MSWRDSFKHAFAVELPEQFAPTEDQRRVAERICRWLVRRRLTQAACITLEAHRGLNYFGAHALHFFRPAVAALCDTHDYQTFAEMLEHRGSIDFLIRRIEELEEEAEQGTKPGAGSGGVARVPGSERRIATEIGREKGNDGQNNPG